jgi:ribosome-interacting GTPase 1
MSAHRSNYKKIQHGLPCKYTSSQIFNEYGVDNCEIVLIENFPCDSKEELHKRERYWIETMECVNKVIPTRTSKEYREINTEKKAEYLKEWYETNKEKIKEHNREYYEENKEKIKERSDKHFDCECGGSYTKHNKSRHLKSKKHQN